MALKRLIIKLLKIAILVEVVYVLLINAALQLPMTQTLINKIRPEKFHISWQSAWSPYPFRVYVSGGAGNGQARSQQWQFAADSVSASISLLPLIFKRVWIRNVSGSNIEYRQRPRLKPDKDFAAVMPYFPEIEGWEISDADTSPRKSKRPWHVSINDITVSGQHSIWIYQMQGSFKGEIKGDLKVRSRGGPFSLDIHELELGLGPFLVNGDQEMFHEGLITGSMGFAEFVPRENKGVKMMPFLILDLDVDIDLNNLAFINLLTQNLEELKVGGRGHVDGRLRYNQGNVLGGTDLVVDADDLRVELVALTISGDGEVSVERSPGTDNLLDLAFEYEGLELTHVDDPAPMLTGQGLELHIGGDGYVLKDSDKTNPSRTLSFSIEGLAVPDLALFQRYLPAKWPFDLHGGTGSLSGQASLAPTAISVNLRLESDQADMGLRQYRFDTNLDAALRLENPSIMTQGTAISGTYIALTGAQLKKEGEKDNETWEASIRLNEGELSILGGKKDLGDEHAFDLLQSLGRTPAKEMLGNSRGLVGFEAEVSSLAWLAVFLSGDHSANVDGRGEITGDVYLEAGLPADGTHVEVLSDELSVDILDYVSSGEGRVELQITQGGQNPDWKLDVELKNGAMRRAHETAAGIRDVNLQLQALVEDVTLDMEADNDFTLKFSIPSARVTDMAVFNGYLPPDAPMQFTGGTADLTADIELDQDDAGGWMKLVSNGLEAEMDDQLISGDLALDVLIAGGVPAEMRFDISGSNLRLDNMHVSGEASEFDQDQWSALFTLVDAQTVFRDPLQLDAEAELQMSDSRPIVAMFSNSEKPPPKFLANMMTVEDIRGTALMHMKDDRIVIPHAHAISDNIEVGAKGVITEETTNGVFYARYKKLGAIIKIENGKKNLDIIRARAKYDEYQVEP